VLAILGRPQAGVKMPGAVISTHADARAAWEPGE